MDRTQRTVSRVNTATKIPSSGIELGVLSVFTPRSAY